MNTEKFFSDILSYIEYKRWSFHLGCSGDSHYLQVKFVCECSVTGKPEPWSGRKWYLSPHMTKSEVVQTAFKAVLTAEEHESREKFKYNGQAIFGPHFDVDVLASVCKLKEMAMDVREAL